MSSAAARDGSQMAMADAPISLPHATLATAVTKLLECQICLDPCVSPINTCKNGHLTCGLCYEMQAKKGIVKCPQGCDGLLQVSAVAERLSREWDVSLPCENAPACKKPINAAIFNDHMKNCEFRDIRCDFKTLKPSCKYCTKDFAISGFLQHLVKAHGIPYTGANLILGGIFAPLNYTMDYWGEPRNAAFTWVLGATRFDNNDFLLLGVRSDFSYHWWLLILSGQEEADKYRYEAKVIPGRGVPNGEDENPQRQHDIRLELPVLPYHKYHRFNRSCGKYASITGAALVENYVKRGANGDQGFRVSAEIIVVEK